MRFGSAAILFLVAACAPSAPAPTPDAVSGALPADCVIVMSRPVAFTDTAGGDVIEARSLPAPTCDQSVLVVSVRASDGRLLHAFAAPYGQMSQSPPDRGLSTVLQSWVQARIDDTSAAPAWSGANDAFPAAFGETGGSPFIRSVYEAIRAQKRPRLCLATSYEAFQCLYYEAESGQAGVLFTASP